MDSRTSKPGPVSRRQMLCRLGVVAMPFILPSRLAGQGAPSGKIHLAMIGTGRQAFNTNLPALMGIPDVRVVAVCDVDRKRAEAAKNKVDGFYGTKDCKLFGDFREALQMPDLDAVMTRLTNFWEAPIVVRGNSEEIL